MRHDLSIAGACFRLRPIGDADAGFVVELRSNRERAQHLNRGAQTVEQQLEWFRWYYSREGDYYFVVERLSDGRSEGLIAVYDVQRGCGEWGRWILRPDSSAAVESAWLIYRAGFELLELQSMYCRTVAFNRQVVSFHDSCGVPTRRVIPAHFTLDDRKVDAVEHCIDREGWPAVAARLGSLAATISRRSRHA